MHRRQELTLGVILVAVIGVARVGATQVQAHESWADASFYNAVRDRLYSYPTDVSSDKIVLLLRYDGVAGDRQYVIVQTQNERDYHFTSWRLPDGEPNVWDQIAKLKDAKPELTADQVASSIRIVRGKGTILTNSRVAALLRNPPEFHVLAVAPTEVFLDGGDYRVVSRSASETIDIELQGPKEPSTSQSSLIRWMGQVLSALEHSPS